MLDIVISPNPVLLEKSTECMPGDASLRKLSSQMQEVMYHYVGVGLAGPQVGQLKRIVVIDTNYDLDDVEGTKNPITLVNPVIDEHSDDMEEADEGCLSCPGISAPVMRYTWVKVKYFDLDGKEQFIDGDGLLSHALQHEIDHLDGKTLFQTANPQARLQLLQDYKIALENGAQPGQVE